MKMDRHRFEATANARSLAIDFSAELENIDRASSAVQTFLEDVGFQEVLFGVELVLREVLLNAVIHGCGSNPDRMIDCRLGVDDDVLTLVVGDKGEGFQPPADFEEIPPPDIAGSRGGAILRQYATSYSYNDVGNEITIHFNVNHPGKKTVSGKSWGKP